MGKVDTESEQLSEEMELDWRRYPRPLNGEENEA
jgi:hypothetical protein